ncbi:MAG: LTA synthase family protein [Planctomycetia bacterium]|nr:LTA synthase family protein [Planctomycetia bacterium]
MTVLVFLSACFFVQLKFHVAEYLIYGSQKTVIFDNYCTPDKAEIAAPAQKKNFVWIISESLEESYNQKEIFGEDLIAELTALQDQGLSVPNWVQVDGTGWTIASLISSLYGVPRRIVWNNRAFSENSCVKILRQSQSVFHVLKDQGYEIVFVQGDSLTFAGRNYLFENFPWVKALSRENLSKTPEYQAFIKKNKPYNWGVHDQLVFDNAEKEYERLAASKKPFVLVVQTLDTHGKNGFLVPDAERKYNDFRDVVREQSRMISQFVKNVRAVNGSANTAILIMGDHLAMQNTIQDMLERVPERRVFNLWLNGSPQVHSFSSSPCSTFDFAPTILEFLGFRWKDHQFGIGVSCCSHDENLLKYYSINQYEEEFNKESEVYDQIMLGEIANAGSALLR